MPTSSPLSVPSHPRLRALFRLAFRWWTRLTVRDLSRTRVVDVDGIALILLPSVFDGVRLRTGAFLARALDAIPIDADTRVLDLGTGCGIAAVFAARRGAHVVATDINPDAVRCAKINALAQHLDAQIDTRTGDLFAPVQSEQFDLILFNPPYYRGPARDMADRAWRSPDVFDHFLRDLPAHLTVTGRALLVISSDNEIEDALHAATWLLVRRLRHRDLFNEILTIYDVSARAQPAVPQPSTQS